MAAGAADAVADADAAATMKAVAPLAKRRAPGAGRATKGPAERADDEHQGADVDAGSREHYTDAALYDYEYRRRRTDVAFYRQLAATLAPDDGNSEPAGPILDLACGSGRVTIPLARDGYQVVGLDASEPMLAAAEARLARQSRAVRSRVTLVPGDMRQFELGQQFSLIVMAFNSFEHLYTRVEVAACLECVRAHLAPGGHLVFDVQNPDPHWLVRDPDKRWARTRFTHPASKRRYVYSSNHIYDPVSQIALIRMYYQPIDDSGADDGTERVVRLSQRKFFPAELEALLYTNGFRVSHRFGDFGGEPLTGECEAQVLVCHPRAVPPERTADGSVIGIRRGGEYMYYVKGTALWRMPYGDRSGAEPVVELDIDERDPAYVYLLDERGRVVRVPRPAR